MTMVKRFVAVSAVLLATGILAAPGIHRFRNAGQVNIGISPSQIDFTSVPRGQEASRTVTVTNQGRGTVVVERVDRDCTCTRVSISNRLIKPGKTASLFVAIKGSPELQNSTSEVLLTLSAIEEKIRVPIHVGKIILPAIDPLLLDFGRVAVEDLPTVRSFRINRSAEGFPEGNGEILAYCSDEAVQLSSPNDFASSEQYLNVTLTEGTPLGEFLHEIRVTAEGSENSLLVTATGFVRGGIYAEPPSVALAPGATMPGRIATNSVLIRSRDKNESIDRIHVVDMSKELDDYVDVVASGDKLDVSLKRFRLGPLDGRHRVSGRVVVAAVSGDSRKLVAFPVVVIFQ
jgi:hypothetical protein